MERRPAVVALHGGPGLDGTKLRHLMAPLADVAQVVVPDQRGHGRSDRGKPESWSLARWAADVSGLCDLLEVAHPVVLGVSFGGFVAQQYAAAHPDEPAGLVLVSSGPRFEGFEEGVARFREVGGEEAAEVFRRNWESPSVEADSDWERVLGPLMSCRENPDPVLGRVEEARIRTMEVNHHWMPEGKATDLRPALTKIRCPTLVILGERDPLVPPHLGREIVDAIPPGLARLELIPRASHDVFGDSPEEMYRLIRDFLRQVG
jgi:proline iminopeptidase